MKKYAVIMAGGCGVRFWPLSRKSLPKQLLNLTGKDVMLNETADRLAPLVGRENVFVVTSAVLESRIKAATAGKILSENILCEPAPRGTAACIGYAAEIIRKKYGDGVIIVTPSDAYIRDEKSFRDTLEIAAQAAEKYDSPVTVGIKPTFAATGYGYIRFEKGEERAVKKVLRFVEKPDRITAETYLKSGEYLWNSGMFIWKTSVVLRELKKYLPEIYDGLETIAESFGKAEEKAVTEHLYPAFTATSVDYGIMEKADDILVAEGDFGWNDVGSWDGLEALYETDEYGNVCAGDVITQESENCVLYSSGRTLAVLGVENLVVVETSDAVMVCPKDRAQDVKTLIEKLNRIGRKELL